MKNGLIVFRLIAHAYSISERCPARFFVPGTDNDYWPNAPAAVWMSTMSITPSQFRSYSAE